MPISADKVRELVARREGTKLDFKARDHDWAANRAASNAELAKDLMALGNMLRPNSEPAYILTGVQNDGTIVGVPPASHYDDAILHQKVQGALNRTPVFAYAPVEVDGMSIGVYEIRGGARPYFPLRDAPPSLRRHVAMYRNGTATEEASPTMILEWAREDDPDAHRMRALELRKLEAEARVHGRMRHVSVNTNGNDVVIKLLVENRGRSGFWIERCDWRAEWNDQFREALTKAGVADLPIGYVPPGDTLPLNHNEIVQPGGKPTEIDFRWTRAEALGHITAAGIGVPGFSGNWAAYHFEVLCRGELSGEAVLSWTVRP